MAELWRPGQVLAAFRDGLGRPEADRRVDRWYGNDADLLATPNQLADDITAWLAGAAPTPSGSAPTAPP